jgi:hypothetical protein
VRLRGEGRLLVSEAEVLALSSQGRRGQTEQTLFGFSVRELAAPDAAARIRAAERLRALGDPAAAPALAAALHAEREPEVLVTLLGAFANLAQQGGTPVAAALLTALSPDVRIAALKAVLQLDPAHAAPHIAAAVGDPDPSVRRRASLLALSLAGEEAQRLSQEMARDKDPEVRRLTALALGASGRSQARIWLLEMIHDEDTKVRRASAQSLSQLLGQDVGYLVNLDDAQRRREVRRLASAPLRRVKPEEVLRQVTALDAPRPPLPAAEHVPLHSVEPLCSALAAEIRCALRGCTATDLARTSNASEAEVHGACELLIARGQVVRRGTKYFTA